MEQIQKTLVENFGLSYRQAAALTDTHPCKVWRDIKKSGRNTSIPQAIELLKSKAGLAVDKDKTNRKVGITAVNALKRAIKKKDGTYRIIYIQNPWLKKSLRAKAEKIFQHHAENFPKSLYHLHGFVMNRNCITNAKQHISKKFTLSLDFRNFFDTVGKQHLQRMKLDEKIIDKILINNQAKQGLSSSPAAANLAAARFDEEILQLIAGTDIVYTRYADDLNFSSDNLELLKSLRPRINKLARKFHFRINHEKTRIQSASYGRRIITGVAVDSELHVTRRDQRKLRALQHRLKKEPRNRLLKSKVRGMREWCSLKEPKV